ncbi:MAG TPA: hypothetical protein VH438_17325 [Gemmatimonadales bacterium]
MRPSPLLRPLAVLLFAGSLLLVGASSVHPVLHGTASDQLAMISGTGHWRAIHLLLSLGTGLFIAGLGARALATPDSLRVEYGIVLIVLGLGELLNGVNIAFMTAAGTELAALERQTPGSTTLLYQGIHPATLMAARLGSFLVAIAALLLTRLGGHDPAEPRLERGITLVAGVVGLAAVLLLPETNIATPIGIGIMALWGIVASVRLLRQAS